MRSVLASGRIGGRPGRVVHGTLSGIWLGMLSDRQLRALDERYYSLAAVYRTAEWNERGLWPWEQEAVRRSFTAGSRIVVPGCGGGREVLALLRCGFDAVGYEPHPALAAYAQRLLEERGHPGKAFACGRERFPAAGRCDGVLFGWGAYSLIAPRRRRIAFLAAAAAALAHGGAVVLSAFERPLPGREFRLTAAIANRLRGVRRAPGVELGDSLAPNRVHLFTGEELAGEIAAAGLRLDGVAPAAVEDAGIGYLRAIGRAP